MSDSVRPHRQQPTRLLCPCNLHLPPKHSLQEAELAPGHPPLTPQHLRPHTQFKHFCVRFWLEPASRRTQLPPPVHIHRCWALHATSTKVLSVGTSRMGHGALPEGHSCTHLGPGSTCLCHKQTRRHHRGSTQPLPTGVNESVSHSVVSNSLRPHGL